MNKIWVSFGKAVSEIRFTWQFLSFQAENQSLRLVFSQQETTPTFHLSFYPTVLRLPVGNPAPNFGFPSPFLGVPGIQESTNFKAC